MWTIDTGQRIIDQLDRGSRRGKDPLIHLTDRHVHRGSSQHILVRNLSDNSYSDTQANPIQELDKGDIVRIKLGYVGENPIEAELIQVLQRASDTNKQLSESERKKVDDFLGEIVAKGLDRDPDDILLLLAYLILEDSYDRIRTTVRRDVRNRDNLKPISFSEAHHIMESNIGWTKLLPRSTHDNFGAFQHDLAIFLFWVLETYPGADLFIAPLYEAGKQIFERVGEDRIARKASYSYFISKTAGHYRQGNYTDAKRAFRRVSQLTVETGGKFPDKSITLRLPGDRDFAQRMSGVKPKEGVNDILDELGLQRQNEPSAATEKREVAPKGNDSASKTNTTDPIPSERTSTEKDKIKPKVGQEESPTEERPSFESSRSKVTTTQIERDQEFREDVLKAYNKACAICGVKRMAPDGRPEAEAAHIYPVKEGGPDYVRNGIALCRLHHWAFDNGWVSVTDDYRIVVRDQPLQNGYNDFIEFEGEDLHLPEKEYQQPHPEFLEMHRDLHGFKID